MIPEPQRAYLLELLHALGKTAEAFVVAGALDGPDAGRRASRDASKAGPAAGEDFAELQPQRIA